MHRLGAFQRQVNDIRSSLTELPKSADMDDPTSPLMSRRAPADEPTTPEGEARHAVLQHKAQSVELAWVKEELHRHRAESHVHLTELIKLRTELRHTNAESDVRAVELSNTTHALQVSFLGDAESSLGVAESSLGDAGILAG